MKLPLLLSFALLALLTPALAVAADRRAMTVDDLFKFKRVADPQISPDGKLVAYTVTTVENVNENKTASSIWLAATDGSSPPRQLTNSGKKDRHARWSPDGKRILFESNRSGSYQLWLIDLDGGEARQLTTVSTEANNAGWSPDGSMVAFVSAVYPEYSEQPFKESDAANKKRDEEKEKSPVKAKAFSKLFYRHWDSYVEDKRQHLFVLQLHYRKHESPATPEPKFEPKDVTPGDRDAYPTSDTFESGDNFTFSPDGNYLIFTAVPAKNEAWSTSYEICRVPVTGGTKEWENLTKDNPAANNGPRLSPDGKRLAYRAQRKPGYEADKWELMVVGVDPTGAFKGKPLSLTKDQDRSVDEIVWGADSGELYFSTERQAATSVIRLLEKGEGKWESDMGFGGDGTKSSLTFAMRGDVRHIVYSQAHMYQPAEVEQTYVLRGNDEFGVRRSNLSHANDKLLAELDLPRPESVTVKGAGGTPMQMWVLKPPGFDPAKKWPVAYLVHGGPQGAWEDGWSYRWNPELWAAQGYVVALPNPRGSTGFGQKYVDEISGDWGGKCYDDLMAGVDYMEGLPYVDKTRIAAAGASFGGYMMDWFAVTTGRFKCLISHCSVWNFESMWGTTDELWFDEYEHGGLPWEVPGKYAEFSPHRKAGNLGKFKTPMLVIQNDLDFRCPIGQGHELFSALQRQGVPSRFINFPDEGHWVLKPANSAYWHKEVFAWLTKYCPPGGR